MSRVAGRATRATRGIGKRLLAVVHRILLKLAAPLERFRLEEPRLEIPPYQYVQTDTEQNLHRYLGLDLGEVRRWVIVGAWHGTEVDRLLQVYSHCRFVLLEPSRQAFHVLETRWAGEPRCECIEVAASDEPGEHIFYERELPGNGSLLPPISPEDPAAFVFPENEVTASYSVRKVRLDELFMSERSIDCLWIDVQGHELAVLRGAEGILDRVRAIFVEVATWKVSYEGAAMFGEVAALLEASGFRLASLGTDPMNGQGNSLWLRA